MEWRPSNFHGFYNFSFLLHRPFFLLLLRWVYAKILGEAALFCGDEASLRQQQQSGRNTGIPQRPRG